VESPVRERPKEVLPPYERQEGALPVQYGEPVTGVRSGDGRQEEKDDPLQTLNVVEKTMKVRILGLPLVEVTRESRWTDENGIPVVNEGQRRSYR
jgi:hypothetical protein